MNVARILKFLTFFVTLFWRNSLKKIFVKSTPSRVARGFTLIELLIVVAIIAILAAIAVPNFLEAQVRSKVSRVKADMRTLATAIETYTVDNNKPMPIYNGPTADCKIDTAGYRNAFGEHVGTSDGHLSDTFNPCNLDFTHALVLYMEWPLYQSGVYRAGLVIHYNLEE